jgi:hypothetical protein
MQMRDLLELADIGDVQDVVAAVVQVVAVAAHGAQRGVARGHARERDGFLGLEATGLKAVCGQGHTVSSNVCS